MAFTKTPTTWIDNWAYSAPNITIPLATFPEMSADDAHTSTGDIRKIVFAVMEKLWLEWVATETANRPGKWTMTKSASVNTATGITTVQYVNTFLVSTTAQDVADEA
jgi:hypothetical protein